MAAKKKTNWIADALSPSTKGVLHKQLGVPAGEKIPAKKLAAAAEGEYGEKAAKRARLAQTLGSFRKKKG